MMTGQAELERALALYPTNRMHASNDRIKGQSTEQVKNEELFKLCVGGAVFVVFAFVALAVLLWSWRVVIG